MTADEYWDLVDGSGRPLGKTLQRGCIPADGEYHHVVHVWIRNSGGRYLITRRAAEKNVFPGLWEIPGGCAVAGETVREAAVREVR